jgi:hypothetical protein
MALLDLQGMESEAPSHGKHSSTSGHSCPSDLSATLCDHNSGLSLLLCYESE